MFLFFYQAEIYISDKIIFVKGPDNFIIRIISLIPNILFVRRKQPCFLKTYSKSIMLFMYKFFTN